MIEMLQQYPGVLKGCAVKRNGEDGPQWSTQIPVQTHVPAKKYFMGLSRRGDQVRNESDMVKAYIILLMVEYMIEFTWPCCGAIGQKATKKLPMALKIGCWLV